MAVYDIGTPSAHSLINQPVSVLSTVVFTILENLLITESEDPWESSKPINMVNDNPTGSFAKARVDVIGLKWNRLD